MDVNYHTNRIIAHRSPGGYFVGSPSRQYGSGIGSALRLGLKGFVLPIAKKRCILSQKFHWSGGPELLKVLEGISKPKESIYISCKDHYMQTIERRKEWNLSEALQQQHSSA